MTDRFGKPDPREHLCACGRFGSCGIGNAWFCVRCAPASYWPPKSVAPAAPIADDEDVI